MNECLLESENCQFHTIDTTVLQKNILQLTVAFSNVHANKVSTGNKAMDTLGDTPVVNTEDLDNKNVMSFNPELTLGSTQDTKLHIDQQKC